MSSEDKNNEENTIDDKAEESIQETTADNKVEENIQETTADNKVEENVQENSNLNSFIKFIIVFFTTLIFITIFSTIFGIVSAFFCTTYIKGTSIKGINVSGLTIEEAATKINKAFNIESNVTTNLYYENEQLSEFTALELSFDYNYLPVLIEAYNYGRTNNIVVNNYEILYSLFFGKDFNIDYTYNEDALNNIVKNVSANIPGLVEQPSYYIEDSNLIITNGKPGFAVNTDEIKTEILDSIYNLNAIDVLKSEDNSNNIYVKTKYEEPSKINIDEISEKVCCEPQDAYYEEDPFKIIPEQDGIEFAISIDEAKDIISNSDSDEYTIPLILTPAEYTIDDIGVEAFPYKISTYSTKYDASNINRSKNLVLAASKINGKVLMPGDTFSFNGVVGKRTIEDGYKDALIYQNGKVVNGLAGGICQISSTLYNATLLANLEIVERYNHSYTSSYVPAGRDATVVYGAKDFVFKNTRSYPIKLEASVAKGIATFTIYGVEESTEYDINIKSVTTSVTPYTVTYTPDATLQPGQQKVTQSGHAGYRVTTYIERSLNGVLVSKDVISNDVYKPMNTIINVGP